MKLYHLDHSGSFCAENGFTLSPQQELPSLMRDSRFFRPFKNGVSRFALHMFPERVPTAPFSWDPVQCSLSLPFASFQERYRQINIELIEFIFELVRQTHFPHLPSRLSCVFAVDDVKEFERWPELSTENPRIFEIDVPDRPLRFDSNHLKGFMIFAANNNNWHLGVLPTVCYDFAFKYWAQESSDDPRWEYLIPLPVSPSRIRQIQ